jgi:hypothetical protein
MNGRITKAERAELAQAVRLQCKVARAGLEARKAELLADFEEQLATRFAFTDDRWSALTQAALCAVDEADTRIAIICEELGIPSEFRPALQLEWWDRGENATAKRRSELRRVAITRLDAMLRAAKVKVDQIEAELRIDLVARGLTTNLGREFLASVPGVTELMPHLELHAVEEEHQQTDEETARRHRR